MIQKFNIENIEIFHTIGRGGYGRVKIARSKTNTTFFALKVLKKSHLIRCKQVDHIFSELSILAKVQHPFIVRFFGFSQDQMRIFIALEYIPGGDLFTFIRINKMVQMPQAILYSAQITTIIEYLHYNNIVYRDLKPENLLISGTGYLKLTDFGLAKIVTDRTYTFCGTPEYLAPEIVLKKPYGKAVDWWGLGVIIYEMLVGVDPFHGNDPMGVYENIINCKLKFPRGFDKTAKSLIKHLLVVDLSKRFGNMKNGAEDVRKHRWFREINWEYLVYGMIEMPYIPNVRCQGDTSNFYRYPDSEEIEMQEDIEDDPFINW